MSIRRHEQNGQIWETRPVQYVRHAGEPCMQLDMRGDPETFFGSSFIIVEVCDLGGGWMRYWYQDRDPELRRSLVDLVEAQERLR